MLLLYHFPEWMGRLTVLSLERDEDTEPEGHPLPEYDTLPMVIPVGLEIGAPVAVVDDFDVVGSNPGSPGTDRVGSMPATQHIGASSIRSDCILI